MLPDPIWNCNYFDRHSSKNGVHNIFFIFFLFRIVLIYRYCLIFSSRYLLCQCQPLLLVPRQFGRLPTSLSSRRPTAGFQMPQLHPSGVVNQPLQYLRHIGKAIKLTAITHWFTGRERLSPKIKCPANQVAISEKTQLSVQCRNDTTN